MSNLKTQWLLEESYKLLRKTGLLKLGKNAIYPIVNQIFFLELLNATGNFQRTKWLGKPIMQNILDLWVIQETICELQPKLIIECGTNQGGSAYFYANLFDLMGDGKVITIDVEKMHDLTHPRIEFIIGSSISDCVISNVREAVSSVHGTVMVILDSDHSANHVSKELELYAPFVTPNSFVLVQDGIMDTLPVLKGTYPPGPISAIRDFLERHPEFEVDAERSQRFLISHHPEGWLRKKISKA